MTTWTEARPLLETLAALDPLEGLLEGGSSPVLGQLGYEWTPWILECGCRSFHEQCGRCGERRRIRDLVRARRQLQQDAELILRLTERVSSAEKAGVG